MLIIDQMMTSNALEFLGRGRVHDNRVDFTSKLHLPLSVVYITAEERNFKAKGVLKEILFGRSLGSLAKKPKSFISILFPHNLNR